MSAPTDLPVEVPRDLPMEIPAEMETEAAEIFARYPDDARKAAALPLLHLAQSHFGYISDDLARWVAEQTGVSPIHVRGLVTFYPMLRDRPCGRYQVKICRTLTCEILGATTLLDYLRIRLGIDVGETTGDGRFGLETVECLAACDRAPVMQINETTYDRLTPEKIDEILDSLE